MPVTAWSGPTLTGDGVSFQATTTAQWCHDCSRPCQRLGADGNCLSCEEIVLNEELTGDEVDNTPSKNLPLQDSPSTMKKSPRFQGKLMGIVYSSVIDAPLAEVFAWHQRPGAIHRLTPPWQPVSVAQEADSLQDGRAILKMPGHLSWVAQHGDYDPPHRFVDELTSLPLHWRHSHEFEAVTNTSTRVTDRVDTRLPAVLLRQMFIYRHRQLADDLAIHHDMARLEPESLTVAITGSSGLVGSALTALLTTGGHRVIRLVRREPRDPDERQWSPGNPDSRLLDGTDALVHLAGASIAGRFTGAHKQAVRNSRIGPTRVLAELMAGAGVGPRTLVTASAIGYYGSERGDEPLTESSHRGQGFLADVVAEWEAASEPASAAGVRVVSIRTGIVQSPRGGILRLMRPLFWAGLGGRIGNGRQWGSWIDLDDLTDIYYRALVDTGLSGPVNAVAPHPARNADYTTTLARVLRRRALITTPTFGLRIVLGSEGVSELAMAGQRGLPANLLRAGHRFRHPNLEGCLRHQLGRCPAPAV